MRMESRGPPLEAAARLAGLFALMVGLLGVGPAAAAGNGRSGFVDVTEAVGLDYRVKFRPEEEGSDADHGGREDGGLTLFDIDNDGRLELYVAHGDHETGRLFTYDGSRFVRLPRNGGIEPTGMDRAGYFIDLDGDRRADFVSIQSLGVEIFRGDGAGRFEKAADLFGFPTHRATHSVAAADYDGDGDLDLFFAHWNNAWNGFRPPSHYLWRNDGKGRYEDVSRIVQVRPGRLPGAKVEREFSFTPTFADIDADGDPDLLLAGDFGSSQVLRNDAGKVFTDIGGTVLTDENGMGAAVGDYDRDGDLDWFVTSIHDPDGKTDYGPTGNRMYRNVEGSGRFEDVTERAGVREGGWGWGVCLADFDNDGYLDVFQTNGWFDEFIEGEGPGGPVEVKEFLEDPSRLFMSNSDGTFTEQAAALGVGHKGQGRGVVCTDYNGDGRVDLFIANHGAAPTVYANVFENGNHWLAVDLAGRDANPLGIGARVTLHASSGSQMREVRLGGAYLSQAPATLHFGLGRDRVVAAIEVRWPGPGKQTSRLENIPANRRLTIRQPAPEGFLLRVVDGGGGGLYPEEETVSIEAAAPEANYRFSHWSTGGGGAFGDARSSRTTFVMPAAPVTVSANYLPGPAGSRERFSVARLWMEVMLQAIRDDVARPTVHARNLFHLAAAMYDAWASYSPTARPYVFGDTESPCKPSVPPAANGLEAAREEAVSYAAWRLIRHRFRLSPGALRTRRNADTLLAALGHDPGLVPDAVAARPPAALGHCLGGLYITRGLTDGSNEADDYRSTAYYPVNSPLDPSEPDNPGLSDPDRWQPLELGRYVDQAGRLGEEIPEFVSPEWGRVLPFSLTREDLTVHKRDGAEYHVYHDPGPPPTLSGPLSDLYRWGFALVARWSSHLSPHDGVLIDIAPSGMGNIRSYPASFDEHRDFYGQAVMGPGHTINPATGEAYEPQLVPRGDYVRVVAEFWADGPDSETPPGHWFVILNAVGDHERFVRRFGGQGPRLGALEWDVKAYLALGGAMHDAAIAAWGVKGWYDYIRPISALRGMAGRGQSGDPALPSWSAAGIPLMEGFIELVGPGDPLAGADGVHVDKVKLLAWRGPDLIDDPSTDAAGVGWILAENWWPYQRPSFVTPPFAGYVSGHSTYSRAAAEVLTALTGDPFFPGGMSDFPIPANSFLVFERGPSVDMTLQWATYRDAADQCSLSRIWGGIHPPADDVPGRLIGAKVGHDAFRLARSYIEGAAPDRSVQ